MYSHRPSLLSWLNCESMFEYHIMPPLLSKPVSKADSIYRQPPTEIAHSSKARPVVRWR